MIDTSVLNLDPLAGLLFCSSLIVAVIIVQILLADVMRAVSKSASHRIAKICVLSALSLLVTINAIAVIYLWVRYKGIDPLELTSLLSREPTTAACCAVVGYYTYLLRCRARLYYGLVEIGLGLTTTYISADINVPKDILVLLAGAYIVVRGLDNLEKGLEEIPPLHRWWKARFEPHR